MMRTTAEKPATTPIPVQLSDRAFTAGIVPHLAMPKRGPQCNLGYHRVVNLIWWVLYPGMPWQCLPIPHDPHGQPAIHDTTVYKGFATWAEDGSLWQAFMASVAPLAAEQPLDVRVLHGDGTNTVAPKGGMGLGSRVTNTSRARKSSPSQTTAARCWLPSQSLPCMRRP
jgi:transposase